jgi:hypothetical protein
LFYSVDPFQSRCRFFGATPNRTVALQWKTFFSFLAPTISSVCVCLHRASIASTCDSTHSTDANPPERVVWSWPLDLFT